MVSPDIFSCALNTVLPALFIKVSNLFHFSIVLSTVSRHFKSSETSETKTSVSAPRSLHSFATSSASFKELEHVKVRFQPFSASIIATAFPTPLLAPVIMATGLFIFNYSDINYAF